MTFANHQTGLQLITNDARAEFDKMRAKLVEGDEKFLGHETALRAIVEEAKSMFNTLQASIEQNKHELQQARIRMEAAVNELKRRMEMMEKTGGRMDHLERRVAGNGKGSGQSGYLPVKSMLSDVFKDEEK